MSIFSKSLILGVISVIFLSACTAYVVPAHRPFPPNWAPGHYNRFGGWVPGHWRHY